MTLRELREKVRSWDQTQENDNEIADAKYSTILTYLEYYANTEWRIYLPTENNSDFSRNYMDRLAAWIGNITDEKDQKLLLEYALEISFFSHDDFIALYKSAMNKIIFPWIAKNINVKLYKKTA